MKKFFAFLVLLNSFCVNFAASGWHKIFKVDHYNLVSFSAAVPICRYGKPSLIKNADWPKLRTLSKLAAAACFASAVCCFQPEMTPSILQNGLSNLNQCLLFALASCAAWKIANYQQNKTLFDKIMSKIDKAKDSFAFCPVQNAQDREVVEMVIQHGGNETKDYFISLLEKAPSTNTEFIQSLQQSLQDEESYWC